MRANLGEIYNDTITVLNKLDARDGAQKVDTYRKTVLHHCMWSTKATRTVGTDGTVRVGTTQVVQIPENANYKPYRAWVEWLKPQLVTDEETEDPEEPTDDVTNDEYFTIRTGDYIVKGEVIEEVTASTIKKVIPLYEPDAFQVQLFRDATKGAGFTHSTAGILRFTEAYIVEG